MPSTDVSKCRITTAVSICLRIFLPIAAGLLGIFFALHVVATDTAPRSEITVCPVGPPTCDFDKLQDALDSAIASDTVRVEPGVYTEQITLTDGVAIYSTEGPTSTSIVALSGSAVNARNVTSSTISGFAITSQSTLSPLIGIDIFNSHVELNNLIVHELYGADATETQSAGTPAVGIFVSGSSAISITGSTIVSVAGGNALFGSDADGGGGTGVWIVGGEAAIRATAVRRVWGGGSLGGYSWCGRGGNAFGLRADSGAVISVDDSEVTELTGGRPCSGGPGGFAGPAGTAIGIQVSGGQLHLRNSSVSELWTTGPTGWVGWDDPVRAVAISATEKAILENNLIHSLMKGSDPMSIPKGGEAPPVQYSGASISTVGIMSQGDRSVYLSENSVSDVHASTFGRAVGFLAVDGSDITLYRNSFVDVSGSRISSSGVDLSGAASLVLDGNRVGRIYGEDGRSIPSCRYDILGSLDAGSAIGIRLGVSRDGKVTNNVVWDIRGGRGSSYTYGPTSMSDGGDAVALMLDASAAKVYNNTFYETAAGAAGISCVYDGEVPGEPGLGAGLLISSSSVIAFNNVVAGHDIGVLVSETNSVLAERNDLWQNLADYDGIQPGRYDLMIDPQFASPTIGDFHLKQTSPLIDAGLNLDAVIRDYDGNLRPADGNADGHPQTDIGADEYWPPGLEGSWKKVDRLIAATGDKLTYDLALVNYSYFEDLPSVDMIDILPDGVRYVSDTLSVSSGSARIIGDIVHWSGAISASQQVSVSFVVVIENDWSHAHSVVNRAFVDARTGPVLGLEALTLINPLQMWLPITIR